MITEKKENVGGGGSEGVGEYGVGDLVRAQRGEIVFIQLPDHLPMPQPPAPKAADASTAVKTPPAYCSLSRLQVLKIYVYHSAAAAPVESRKQGCGSGSELKPDLIGSVDPESGSGSRRAKMTHKIRKKIMKFHVLKWWMFSFES